MSDFILKATTYINRVVFTSNKNNLADYQDTTISDSTLSERIRDSPFVAVSPGGLSKGRPSPEGRKPVIIVCMKV